MSILTPAQNIVLKISVCTAEYRVTQRERSKMGTNAFTKQSVYSSASKIVLNKFRLISAFGLIITLSRKRCAPS